MISSTYHLLLHSLSSAGRPGRGCLAIESDVDKEAVEVSSQQGRADQVVQPQLVQLLGGDELVVVVDGGGGRLLELLSQAVEEGCPPWCRAKRRDVEHL